MLISSIVIEYFPNAKQCTGIVAARLYKDVKLVARNMFIKKLDWISVFQFEMSSYSR